jgi:hypothetical protein
MQDNTNDGTLIIQEPGIDGQPPGGAGAHLWGVKDNAYNPAHGWIQNELEMCLHSDTSSASKGFINLYINGQRNLTPQYYPTESGPGTGPIIQYKGRTDNFSYIETTFRAITFGSGMYNNVHEDPTIVSYYSDIYADSSAGGVSGQVARVIIGDQPTYTACALCVPQVINSWSNTNINFTCWKDKFTTGQTGYIYVVTESGTVVPAGSAIWA